MTPPSSSTIERPGAPSVPDKPPAPSGWISPDTAVRLLVTFTVVVLYYAYREPVVAWLHKTWEALTGYAIKQATVGVWLVASLLLAAVLLWRHVLKRDKRF